MDIERLEKLLDARLKLYGLMIDKPAVMPKFVRAWLKRNEAYERQASHIVTENQAHFPDAGSRCFALFQLYQLGESGHFPLIAVNRNTFSATYWLLWAFVYNSNRALVFLHSLVPECFIPGYRPSQVLQATNSVLKAMQYISRSGASIQERWYDHVIACHMADIKNSSRLSMPQAFRNKWVLFACTSKELEPHEVLTGKDN